eukprot:CAMPEP_0117040888 /NCGR_PEP_ID=MMETSP0472-20121206/28590_1 /TAXON_ID=693140 ORGANISM="Tiarina fusus, Strain LIS" /NCGR_SAMPLE_ID=MMETSP0472 /ASSEMBLY_ACC=CAM_ASM_000603 /LENGTH=366 /DNA_ID=CAMNT_0004751751 /DNA_START=106 /DNA_END=1206 /DNA_ORIENTATION=+
MKLFLSTLLLAAIAQAQIDDTQFEACTGCLEDIDDARDCLRECNNQILTNSDGDTVSLLSECLRDNGDFGDVTQLSDLSDCCDFDRGCENDLGGVQDCLTDCLDTCIQDDADAYLQCVRTETGSRGCELTACLDGFLSDDIEDDLSLAGSEDIFDIRSIANTVSQISEDDVADCELLRDFIETTCDLGRSCCDRCDSELGAMVGCLINDIVIPFIAIETNTTIAKCPIDEQDCELGRTDSRKASAVTPEEAELFNKAVNLPKGGTSKAGTTKRNTKREAIVAGAKKRRLEGSTTDEEIAACESQMRLDIVASNMTHATNKYMECITGAAIMSLEDEETDDSEGGSAASAVAKLAALAFSAGAALLF